MKLLFALLPAAAPAWAQVGQPGPWRMHDWGMGWGGGMVLGPLLTILLVVLLVALIVPFVRAIGSGKSGPRAPTARDILDERYARGEIDREEYLHRRQDIDGG
jgi:putative membrane protein